MNILNKKCLCIGFYLLTLNEVYADVLGCDGDVSILGPDMIAEIKNTPMSFSIDTTAESVVKLPNTFTAETPNEHLQGWIVTKKGEVSISRTTGKYSFIATESGSGQAIISGMGLCEKLKPKY